MKKNVVRIVAVLLAAFMVLGFAGCSKSDKIEPEEQSQAGSGTEDKAVENQDDKDAEENKEQAEETKTIMDKIKENGKIVLGTSADYAPYEFHKMIDGKDTIVGFDIEIAKEIAKELGVELEIQDMGFDGLLMALQEGKIDFVIAGMTPDEERKKQVDFTKIYYMAEQGVVIRTEDAEKIKTIEDLNGKKVGVQLGSTQEKIANEQMTGAKIKGLTKVTDLVMEIKNNKVDALVMELPVAKGYIQKNKDLMVAEVKVQEDVGGSAIAVAKGNEELVQKMDEVLDKLMSEGKIDQFVVEAIELSEE